MIELREINKDNINAVLRLKVRDDQKDQVATNAWSIAQGTYFDDAWYRAIYSEDTPVGFVMLSIDPKEIEYWIWRYMIDKDQQGQGYGMAALSLIVDHFKTLPGVSEIKLSYVPDGTSPPNKFYEKAGFVETGVIEEGEMVMKYSIR